MRIKLIKTEQDYEDAVALLEEIGDHPHFQNNEELIFDYELLTDLVGRYEKEHYNISTGHPLEIIQLKMNYMDLKRKDLGHIASSGVLSEVFNKKRGLSKKMIRQFSELLGIDQDLLNVPYELQINEDDRKGVCVFAFIKRNKPNLERFKARTRQSGMVFNMMCQ